ncbi:two-component system, NtrC family, sensor kinase [Trichlorobacter thiogenes]|uniref:histidine kinase n=1 Tax=Trichlorobacter thiogenes TaxID=115783 RepID=A0A1T4N5Q2_9BACT|nr:sensor histidine kinase [Trichlorobacter thiogenes]SJZ74377.1 two-component system, NtrC family, sensor kinase [Trichlorobacter thiogenes]
MQRLGIRRKTLIALLGVAVPALIAFSALIILTTAHILQQNAGRQVSTLASRSAQGLAELVDHSQTTLRTMAASPELAAFRVAALSGSQLQLKTALARMEQSFLGWQKLDPTLQAIRLIDPAGHVLVKVKEGKVNQAAGLPQPPYRMPMVHFVGGRDFFQSALQLPENSILISNLERGKIDEEEAFCPAMVRFAIPLLAGDKRVGVLVINVWGDQAGRLINRVIAEQEGSAFLVERNPTDKKRNGIYLFHRDTTCEFGDQTGSHRTVLNDYPPEITTVWLTSDHGVTRDPRSRDMLAHAFYSPYAQKDRGWVVVVNAKRDFFLEPLATIGRLTGLWAVVVVILATAVSLYFARSLTRPLQEVVDGVRRMGQHPAERISVTAGDEVGFLATEINRMADAMQQQAAEKLRVEEQIRNTEKLASIGEMAAGLAHELNTPLGNIKALAVLSRKGIEQGECDRTALVADLNDIADQAGKCSGIIGGLLSFARRSEGSPANHNPTDLLLEAVSLVRLRAEKQQVTLKMEAGGELPMLFLDGDQLRQVFVNILLNGIDAAPGGNITITVTPDNDHLKIDFEDTGCGIPPEHLDRIFDPFFTTKEVGQGTGLGLSVSYGMLQGMGGRIDVASQPGRGTTFSVVLPVNNP